MKLNRFVVPVFEQADYYGSRVQRPVETTLSREELLATMEAFYLAAPPDKHGRRTSTQNQWLRLAVPGSAWAFRLDQLEDSRPNAPGQPWTHFFSPPAILTVDEWFAAPPDAE